MYRAAEKAEGVTPAGPATFTVSTSSGAGGTISPASVTVASGATTTLTVTPETGYSIASVTGCGGSLSANTYSTGAITADCTVTATFIAGHTVTTTAGDNGTITPVTQTVNDGATTSLTVTPNAGFEIQSVSGCGGSLSGNTYTTGAVTADCTVSATFYFAVNLDYGIKQLRFSWSAVAGAAYYKLLEDPDGVSGFTQVGSNITTTSVNHDITLYRRINAKYIVSACNASNVCSIESPVMSLAANLVPAIGYLKASNTELGNYFGYALALSGDGNTLAVGSYLENSNATGIGGDQTNDSALDAGAVYVFARAADGTWSQQAYVKASNTAEADYFGYALSLSSDGNTLAVGAPFEASNATGVGGDEANNSAFNSGAVYVFTRTGTAWSQQAYVKASNTDAGDSFGSALSLSDDGKHPGGRCLL